MPDCRHRWTAQTRIIDNNNGNGSTTAKLAFNTRSRYARVETGFCQRCSAWRGSLGLEPDYRLYVDHLVAVLREVRRVLRHDGTLWLVTSGGALLRFDPSSGALQTWPGVSGVTRIYMDSTVTPRAVYAAMSGGLAVIRAK